VVLRDEKDASAPLRYKAAVPFTGGSATVEYDDMETAIRRYTVTFDLNYTGTANPPKPQKIDSGGKASPPAVPVRTGYTFGGWFLNTAGTGAEWDFDKGTVTANINLYAKWLDNSITYRTVTFHTNGGTPADFTQQVQNGGKVTIPTPPTRDGHTFGGWFLNAAGTGAEWDFDKGTVTTNLGLYAKWTRNTYKVTFNTGGVEPTPEALPAVPYDDKITDPVVTKTGYTLDGWYKEAAKTTKWDFALNTVKEDITLYGTWTQIKYTVTFNAAGGTPAGIIQSVPYGSAATRPANPTRADSDFDDWYAATDFSAKWNFNSIVTADITLYAKWTPLTFAAVIADIAIDAAVNSTSASYTLLSGNEPYTTSITPLTTANSPASVVIDGGGRVITGEANNFKVGLGVTLTLKNITFKTLPLSVEAGGKLVLDTGAVVRGNVATGIMVNGGTLEMKTGALVTENGISDVQNIGSGVRLEGTGSIFTMNGGEISGNEANGGHWLYDGAGVGIHGAGAVFTMNGGSIHDNTALRVGGGILVGMQANNSTLKLTGGEIYNNSAVLSGGGVCIYENLNVTFDMSGGKIRDNQTSYYGGGVYINSGNTFNMTGGEITNNSAGWDGDGVYLGSGSTFTGNPSIGSKVNGKGSIYGNDGGGDVFIVP
jgi:uncharacterized repeat protein (TIGR02543 family)